MSHTERLQTFHRKEAICLLENLRITFDEWSDVREISRQKSLPFQNRLIDHLQQANISFCDLLKLVDGEECDCGVIEGLERVANDGAHNPLGI